MCQNPKPKQQAPSAPKPAGAGVAVAAGGGKWSCTVCTYQNNGTDASCTMCETPQPAALPLTKPVLPQQKQEEKSVQRMPTPSTNPAAAKPVAQSSADPRVQALIDAGYMKQRAIEALKKTSGNVDQAREWLVMNANADEKKMVMKGPSAAAKPAAASTSSSKAATASSSAKPAASSSVSSASASFSAAAPSKVKPAPPATGNASKVSRPSKPAGAASSGPAVGSAASKASTVSKEEADTLRRKKEREQLEALEKQAEDERRVRALELQKHDTEELKKELEEQEQRKKLASVLMLKRAEEEAAQEVEERRVKRVEMEQGLSSIPQALKLIKREYGVSKFQATCTLLLKIVSKILGDPKNAKFRSINLGSDLIQKALVRPVGGLFILRQLGFQPDEAADAGGAGSGECALYIMGEHQMNVKVLETAAKTFSTTVQTVSTTIPATWKQIANVDVEEQHFVCAELRKIVGNVISLPEDRNFRCIDLEDSSYVNHLTKIPQIVAILADLGFRKEKDNSIYLEIPLPIDLDRMECAYNDLTAIYNTLLPSTPLFQVVHCVARENRLRLAKEVVVRLKEVTDNVLTHLDDPKFRRVKVDKVFRQACIAANPVMDDSEVTVQVHQGDTLFQALGFKVGMDVVKKPHAESEFDMVFDADDQKDEGRHQVLLAKLPVKAGPSPRFDLDLFKYRASLMMEVWTSLVDQKRHAKEAREKQEGALREQQYSSMQGNMGPMHLG